MDDHPDTEHDRITSEHEAETAAPAPKPGSPDWLKARIAEHRGQQDQALAFANTQKGAADAYERLLSEMDKADGHGAP